MKFFKIRFIIWQHLTYKKGFSFWKKLHMRLKVAWLFNITTPYQITFISFDLTPPPTHRTHRTPKPKKMFNVKNSIYLKGWIQLFLNFFEKEVVKIFLTFWWNFDVPPLTLNLEFVYCVPFLTSLAHYAQPSFRQIGFEKTSHLDFLNHFKKATAFQCLTSWPAFVLGYY